jgi:flagellar protein FliO/FliZ
MNAAVSTPPATGGSWFALVTLTLLVVLVAVIVWFYRRRLSLSAPDDSIELIGVRTLGARERIVVARVHGRVLVLGHTPSQISLLCELDPDEVPEMPQIPAGVDFARVIGRFSRKESA